MGKRAHSSLQRAGVQILITSAATVRDIISQAGEGGLDDILARALSSQLGLAQPVSTLPEVTLQLFSSDAKRKRE